MATSAETKKALSDALKKLCMDKDYNDISVSEITSVCNLNRQSFYYHFKDKDELLYWTYENNDFGILASKINTQYDGNFLYLLKAMENDRNFYINTLKSDLKVFQQFLFNKINDMLSSQIDAMDKNHSLTEPQKSFLAGYYAFGLCGIIVKWVYDGMKENAEVVYSYIRCLDLQSVFDVYIKNNFNGQKPD
ncbi:MAG: TetR/AcrR family transcriptional regulator [Clostridia bacterium]|nr:TetR/AcrR family transcriptional regulator [Clostridia bacterium]